MPNARVIKNRIKTVKNTGKITKTMAMVSTAKATKVVGLIKASRPYAKRMRSLLGALTSACAGHSLFMENGRAERRLVIVITANRGLCGGYNANLIRLGKEAVDGKTDIWMYGKKGISAFNFVELPMEKKWTHLQDAPSFEMASELADELAEVYETGRYSSIEVVYSEYISAGQQRPVMEQVLPLQMEEGGHPSDEYGVEPLYEPSREGLVRDLVPRIIRIHIYKMLLDAAASEHLARQLAMNSASDNANDMCRKLTLSYNRARQAQITTEISEIVGGAEALN